MDAFRIEGGLPLKGTAAVETAKNAQLPCLAAALLTGEPVTFEAPSAHADISTMLEVLGHLGVEASRSAGGTLTLRTVNGGGHLEAPYDLVRRMRASVLVLGPMVARFKRGRVSLPGGCAIGARPVDLHLRALAALGADIRVEHGFIEATAPRLRGTEVVFDKVTVGGTENLLMAAVLAEGTTVIRNAAREPEVADLCRLLTAMGARIEGAGSDTLRVEGVGSLHGAVHRCIPDRIVAGTLLLAGAITGGDVRCTPAVPEHLEALLVKLREMGARVETGPDWIRVAASEPLRAVDVVTLPYPGFPTDLQAQFLALLTAAHGTGTVKETIFENRFMHVPELLRMGAKIRIEGRLAVVSGPVRLTGAPVMASDLRASASLVLAGLAAEGTTRVRRIYHLDRGYERLEERLRALGGRVERFAE
ncbi:MAG: UDP-N-acetylglucosamine 1-carboxyvinyltransferase [Acidobacteriota bacterium]